MSGNLVGRRSRVILGGILSVQLFMPVCVVAHYHFVRRPALVARGATPCESYQARMPRERPADCDIAVPSRVGDVMEELYIGKHGMTRTLVRSRQDDWLSTETWNPVAGLALVFPLTAFVVAVVARLRKALRTGALWSWQLERYPADELERTLSFYSLPVLLLGMAMVPVTTYVPILFE